MGGGEGSQLFCQWFNSFCLAKSICASLCLIKFSKWFPVVIKAFYKLHKTSEQLDQRKNAKKYHWIKRHHLFPRIFWGDTQHLGVLQRIGRSSVTDYGSGWMDYLKLTTPIMLISKIFQDTPLPPKKIVNKCNAGQGSLEGQFTVHISEKAHSLPHFN